ncbi:tetratricopeptide repeat protein [Flavobacterium caeni]|uniref:Tetratricopeptide repeat-containing protein n=1 Tax=Flavobacterium caeni TaxID=490189 RepID=A0A1G5IS56_9FLAO|nr:hypothetical protein [Flavobacterium caeni]SCY78922.1 hypothetical protein SAMN02927903_02364 [Flavobacterium caeni]
MKQFKLLFAVWATAVSMGSFAQSADIFNVNDQFGNAQLMADNMSNNLIHDDLVVVSYHVVEKINMNFGGSITTYNVSDASLISTKEMGDNNSRVVTPKYGKAKVKVAVSSVAIMNPVDRKPFSFEPAKPAFLTKKAAPKTIYIDLVGTYERVLEKGYRSVDLIKKVADERYFNGNYQASAKWYAELFVLVPDLAPEYYFRYGKSLVELGQTQKGNELIAQYEARSK